MSPILPIFIFGNSYHGSRVGSVHERFGTILTQQQQDLTLRKSKVSALTVSACNFFPPAASPETTPIPLASVAGAAGAGAGAAGAGAGASTLAAAAFSAAACKYHLSGTSDKIKLT